MRILKITLEGFKSYSNRVTIDKFHPQFNAITGPNGTGKSNIFDGICFAMGFKPGTQMRVGSIEELIYKRGQAGITSAAVTIEFENSDKSMSPSMFIEEDLITVTRQIALGGRDRHFVNGHVKKTKEVHRIFAEARLSIDHPQFLVMQGRVTKVINMKPAEILDFFQEAVGTNIFDKERRSSERILREKDDQLQRIESDIATSLQPTLDHLRQEKENYINWMALGAEIPCIRFFWMVKKRDSCKEKLDEVQNLAVNGQRLVEDDERLILNLKSEKEDLSHEKSRLRQELDHFLKHGQLAQLEQSLAPLQKRIVENEALLSDLEKEKKSKEKEINVKSKQLAENESELAKFETNNKAKLTAQKEAEERRDVLRDRLNIVEKSRAAFKEGILLDDDGNDVSQILDSKKNLVSELKIKLKGIEPRAQALRDLIAELKPKVKGKNAMAKYLTKKQELESKLEEIKTELTALGFDATRHAEMMKEHRRVKESIDEIAEELKTLASSGDIRLAQAFRKAVTDENLLPGAVFELFDIQPDFKNFVIALEECAKGKLRQLVVANDEVAQSIFRFSKQYNQRVTCMPLNKVRSVEPSAAVKDQAKVVGQSTDDVVVFPLDCLKIDNESYRQALGTVFVGAFLCGKRQTAEKLYHMPGWKYASITVAGERWDSAGNISGGSSVGFHNLLTTAANYRCCRKKLASMTRTLDDLTAAVSKSQTQEYAADLLSTELDRLKYELEKLEDEIRTAQQCSDEGRFRKAEEDLELLNVETKQLADDIKTLTSDYVEPLTKRMNEATQNKEREMKRLSSEELRLRNEMKSADGVLSKICKDMEELRTMHATLSGNVTLMKTEIQTISEEHLPKLLSRIEEVSNTLKEWREEYEKLMKEAGVAEQEKGRMEEGVSRIEREIEDREERIIHLDKELTSTRQALKGWKNQSEAVTKNLKLAMEELSKQPSVDPGLMPKITEQYAATGLEELKGILEEKTRTRSKLQMKIDKRAIELLSVAEKDFESLKRDKAKVEEQKETVLKFIENVNEQKRVKLESSFAKVDTLFSQIFSTLLPGSNAQLSLLDPQNLSAGIEMKVALSGTTKQSLDELSGGQKSLLALSLILAMLKLNPSPFYILDEVDAALDLNHTQNLGLMIKRYFSESQFIVVSHKENLYDNADVLFRTAFLDGCSTVTRTAV